MNRISKLLLAISILLLAAGVGLAVAQPGDLGGDDQTEQAVIEGTTTTATAPTSGADDPVVTAPPGTLPVGIDGTGTPDAATPDAATPDAATPDAATPDAATPDAGTGGGSGLGSSGAAAPDDTTDGLADTGGTSMILAGLALGALAFFARRSTHA